MKRTLYHLVKPSVWPLTSAISVSILLLGLVCVFQQKPAGLIIIYGLVNLLFSAGFWFLDIVNESLTKKHTLVVADGLRMGFILFIVSEAILFASFFAAFFLYRH